VNQETGDRSYTPVSMLRFSVRQRLTPLKTPMGAFFQIFTRASRLALPLLASPTTSGPRVRIFALRALLTPVSWPLIPLPGSCSVPRAFRE
jgi:hypothetical protein